MEDEQEMKRGAGFHSRRGMTMIEMVGVLGIIAVLVGMIVPKVFDVVTESKIGALASAVQTYEAAITKYFIDVSSVLPLNEQGIPAAEDSGDSAIARSLGARLTLASHDPLVLNTNLWRRFHGPYLEKFNTQMPPELGTQMFLPATAAVPLGTAVTSDNLGWDLKGDDGNSDLLTDSHVAYFKLRGLGQEDFLRLDSILDPLIGQNDTERKLRGRAKWHPANEGTLYLYLAHK